MELRDGIFDFTDAAPVLVKSMMGHWRCTSVALHQPRRVSRRWDGGGGDGLEHSNISTTQ